MNIIIILSCLFIDRYYPIGNYVRRYQWFDDFLHLLEQKWLAQYKFPTLFIFIIAVMPILLITLALQLLLVHEFWNIPWFLFSFLILFYSLGPTHLREEYYYYFSAKDRHDMAAAYASVNTREPHIFNDENEMVRGMAQHLFRLSHQNIFAILFWFLVFGAVGALVYRLILQLITYAAKNDNFYQAVGQLGIQIKQYLDWITVRLLGVCFAIAGNFVDSFAVLIRSLFLPPKDNEQVLIQCGMAAINQKENLSTSHNNEDCQAIDLVERVLVVILVILALMTLTSWLS